MKTCQICQTALDPKEYATYCGTDCIAFAHQSSPKLALEIKDAVTSMIKWAGANNERSLQKEPGPSDLGSECDRQIAYRLAQTPEINKFYDPWAAIVGTAIHQWLDKEITNYTRIYDSPDTGWKTEQALHIDGLVLGHSDAYWRSRNTVLDWKTMSGDRMKLAREVGIAAFPKYLVQKHLYGYGYSKLGYPVMGVGLVCLPRSGRLRDAVVLTEPYDARIARAALDRMYAIAGKLVDLNIYAEPSGFEEIPAHPGDDCGLCPWFEHDRLDARADATGCPGR